MSIGPLEQALESTREVLAGVSGDQLDQATPCASWSVGGLINHIIGAQHFFVAGLTGGPPVGAEDDYASGDYQASYDEAAAGLLAAFGADGVMEKVITLPFGDMPGAAFAGLAANDVFTHGWDLAKATGQPTDLNPGLAAGILEASRANIQDSFRGEEGAPFGPEKDAPEGACMADQLAAFLGRTV